jgi:Flp pilus assembly protein TadD
LDALHTKAVALSNLGRFNESNAVIDKALAIQPYDADILNSKALALLDLGRLNETLVVSDKALSVT